VLRLAALKNNQVNSASVTAPVSIIITVPAAPWSASGLMSHFASPGAYAG
jgi:hypothetical protein